MAPTFQVYKNHIHAGINIYNESKNISKANNIEVLAEGVETEAERDYLMAHGISKMQGYLFGKPSATPQLRILGT